MFWIFSTVPHSILLAFFPIFIFLFRVKANYLITSWEMCRRKFLSKNSLQSQNILCLDHTFSISIFIHLYRELCFRQTINIACLIHGTFFENHRIFFRPWMNRLVIKLFYLQGCIFNNHPGKVFWKIFTLEQTYCKTIKLMKLTKQ